MRQAAWAALLIDPASPAAKALGSDLDSGRRALGALANQALAASAARQAGITPSGLAVQLCGDAHVLNFGLRARPERNLSFDLRRKPSLTAGQAGALRARAAAGEATASLAREFGISRQPLYQYLSPPVPA